jgi:two-component system, cell cycle sensor histidine kinase and response regulator CckA
LPQTPRPGTIAAAGRVRGHGNHRSQPISAPLSPSPGPGPERTTAPIDGPFRAIGDLSPIGMAAYDRDGALTWVNAALCRLLGYSQEELLGDTVARIAHPEDLSRHHAIRAALRSGTSVRQDMELRFVRKDGRTIHALLRGTTLLDTDGHPAGFLTHVMDISARAHAHEQRLSAQAHRFQTAFMNAPIGMALADERGHLGRVNPELCRITGFDEEELLERTLFDLLAPADQQAEREAVSEILTAHAGVREDQRRMVRRDGRPIWTQITVSGSRGESGTIVGLMLQVQDITARKEAEEARRRSEQFLRDIAETLPVLVYVYDLAEGRRVYTNRRGLRTLGYADHELPEGMALVEQLVHPDDQAEAARHMDRLMGLADGESVEHELRIRHADGSWRTMFNHATVYRRDADGRVRQVLGTIEDITQRRQLQAQLHHAQKMEAVGQLAGGIAHDFNNLLTVILGYAESLRAGLDREDPTRTDADQIIKAGKHAAALTQQLLTFARRDVDLSSPLSLNAVLMELESMLRRLLDAGVEIQLRPDPDLAWIKADPSHLEQIIMNLAVNARDAMPHGGTITFSTANLRVLPGDPMHLRGAPPADYVQLQVRDSGHGMDSETRARIFEPFFTTKAADRGTGLGLSVVYGIVEQSGGHILVESAPGVGTTFDVLFPVAARDSSFARPKNAAASVAYGLETVLLVEDDAAVRRLGREGLESHGYHVIEASDSEEALDLARGFPRAIHIAVTDVVLPRTSGVDFARRLVELHPETRVLFVSGYADQTPFERAGLDPAWEYLQKPFTPSGLARAVRKTLTASPAAP